MNSVEKKEIRGLSIKTIWWLVATTAVVVFTILGTYFSILERLTKIEISNTANERYNDLKTQTLDVRMSALELEVRELKDKFETFRIQHSK